MGVKFEWLNHPPEQGRKKGGVARFRIGDEYHHIQVSSIATAMQLHKLLQHAHEAGMRKGDELSAEAELQRVKDWLIG